MTDDELARRSADIAKSAADAAWLSAYSALATAILTLLLVIGAGLAWHVGRKTLDQSKNTHEQMEKDSIEQTRPYVFARLVTSIGSSGAWDLIIGNTGRSSANNLTIKISKWPEEDAVTKALRTMFEAPQILPPNASIRTYWFLGPRDDPSSSGATGIDFPVDLTVTYTGTAPGTPRYQETFHLDPTILGLTPQASSGVRLKNNSDEGKKLSEIVMALNDLRRGE